MRAIHRFLLATTAVFAIAVAAPAATINLTTNLSGPTSTGATTTGMGTFTGILDTTALTLAVNVSFSNLTSPTGGPTPPAHIHNASIVGGTGPVIIPFTGFPAAITSGAYNQTLTLNTTQYNSLVNGLAAGTAYVNVHTSAFPAGEIRGDLPVVQGLQTIPEPGSMMLLAGGVAGLALLRRWKR